MTNQNDIPCGLHSTDSALFDYSSTARFGSGAPVVVDLQVRDFGTIAGSFKGVSERVSRELGLLEARGFNVSKFREGLMDATLATQPFAGLMLAGQCTAVDSDITAAIDRAFSLLHGVDGDIRTANWYLDELTVANQRFTHDSQIGPRTLQAANPTDASIALKGFIAFAADPSALKQESLLALGKVQAHVEAREMKAAHYALTKGRSFSGRMHLCNACVRRGTLVQV